MTNLAQSFAALSILASACAPAEAPSSGTLDATFPVLVSARADGRTPVAGAEVRLGKRKIGETDATGSVRLALSGNEGERTALELQCPSGFASPERPLVVGLRHLSKGSPPPKFEVECVPLVHTVVVGLSAENGAHLPILLLKKKIGETNEFGNAHVLLRAASDERLTLTLDTSQNPNLRPQNPSLTFVTQNTDEFVLLEQKLTSKAAPARAHPRNAGPRPL
jgi:hypothetical protein